MPSKRRTKKRFHLTHSQEARLGIFFLVVGACIYAAIYAGIFRPVPPAVEVRAVSKREISHGDTTKKQVIFTFDGGASAESGEAILAILAKHHVTGTFFLTGIFVKKNPDLVRRMVLEGHEVYDHTYDHPHLPDLTDREIATELDRMATLLSATASTTPRPYFRAPYGDRDQHVLNAAFANGYQSVYWTVDARDWLEGQGETAESVTERILSSARPGTIFLMHIGDAITGAILDGVFTELESRGYKMVSLTQGI